MTTRCTPRKGCSWIQFFAQSGISFLFLNVYQLLVGFIFKNPLLFLPSSYLQKSDFGFKPSGQDPSMVPHKNQPQPTPPYRCFPYPVIQQQARAPWWKLPMSWPCTKSVGPNKQVSSASCIYSRITPPSATLSCWGRTWKREIGWVGWNIYDVLCQLNMAGLEILLCRKWIYIWDKW